MITLLSSHFISGLGFAWVESTFPPTPTVVPFSSHRSFPHTHIHTQSSPPFLHQRIPSPPTRNSQPEANTSLLAHSLAFIELRLVLAKMHWSFDLGLVNEDVDLERDSRMYILWNKPPVRVRFSERRVGSEGGEE